VRDIERPKGVKKRSHHSAMVIQRHGRQPLVGIENTAMMGRQPRGLASGQADLKPADGTAASPCGNCTRCSLATTMQDHRYVLRRCGNLALDAVGGSAGSQG